MTFRRFMGFVAMAFLWTGSQIPVYLFGNLILDSRDSMMDSDICMLGGIPPYIYGDIGGADRWVWFVSGYYACTRSTGLQLMNRFLPTCSVLQVYALS